MTPQAAPLDVLRILSTWGRARMTCTRKLASLSLRFWSTPADQRQQPWQPAGRDAAAGVAARVLVLRAPACQVRRPVSAPPIGGRRPCRRRRLGSCAAAAAAAAAAVWLAVGARRRRCAAAGPACVPRRQRRGRAARPQRRWRPSGRPQQGQGRRPRRRQEHVRYAWAKRESGGAGREFIGRCRAALLHTARHASLHRKCQV